MSEHAEEHSESHYVKIWAILLVLLVVSVLGPMLEIQVITLLTAFGIALVKAYLVIKHFMHLNVQPRFVTYLLSTALVFMLLLFAGTAPDVMKHEGDNWIKTPIELPPSGGSHH
ncbi:MAG: cytochrome C oxidase subunit IV family protein [Deltaproteobacteria bacterium]|nr:cytochrome C oxidase subunit IV family protein [Deltaproteobacteria bacterium]